MKKEDTRFTYGVVCTWRGSIQEVAKTKSGLPGCPYCKGPLYEMDTKEEWDQGIIDFEARGNKGYKGYQDWLASLDRCINVQIDTIAEYVQATGATVSEWTR